MFRQRRSSQKPGDDLLAQFRQQFPEVAATSTATTTQAIAAPTTAVENPLVNAQVADPGNPHVGGDAFQDHDPTPRGSNEPWRFTPSLMDPNSFNFQNFANAPPGYYTPTPGVGMAAPGLGTPLSMPTSGHGINAGPGVMDMGGFQPLPSHQLHHFNPFVQAPPPQTFAPSNFVHQDTGYETMEQDDSPMTSEERMAAMDSAFQSGTPMVAFPPGHLPGPPMGHPLPPSAEKFRFHSTLNAPTAMIKQADEIPVTYLNKGQAYSLSIIDTQAVMPVAPGTKFRTFVRISFEDEEQRQKPGVCWSLWKEGRGANEAHQRGGKLQAVEYVEAGQPAEGDDKRTRVEVETASFDGFSVIWTPGSQGAPEVNIAVRFNFLSTDFSHSKGVKGIPVRLCSKTSQILSDSSLPAPNADPEICYGKVKLFRDHGAERKLSNDVAHVKKSIDKVKHQIAQAESGMKDFGKRKRGSKPKLADGSRPGKVQKNKRTWSISSASSVDGGGGGRTTMEDDLHIKLRTLQDMFTSTRPVSVLYLRGEDRDDPDAHPVALAGDSEGLKPESALGRGSNTDSMVSPSPSSPSLTSNASGPGAQAPKLESSPSGMSAGKGSGQVIKIQKTDSEGNTSGWIEAVGVDPSYRPPPGQTPKPVACFYVRRQQPDGASQASYYSAVYLLQRTLDDFNRRVAKKFELDFSKILKTVHTTQSGLEVEMDDDVVQNLKEGQDMGLEFQTVEPPVKREWEMAVDAEADEPEETPGGGVILRLSF